ncbi:MAG: DUF2798 domain-containing protein [Pseudoruegeria sp.]
MSPQKKVHVLASFMTSGVMSFIVTGVATWKSLGFQSSFLNDWMTAWWFAWPIAFIAITITAPQLRKLAEKLCGH